MRAPPQRSRGSVNPLSVLVVSGIAVAVYCVAMFAPAYLDHLDVMDLVASAYNQVGHRRDEVILEELKGRLVHIGTHREANQDGEMEEVRGLGVADEDITYELNAAEKTALVQVRYVREVRLKPTGRWVKLNFTSKKAGTPAGMK